jgi:tetratricopeptide (TPR) repeat protein
MTTRFRAGSVAVLAAILGLSLAIAGCGKYSPSNLWAIKAFKDGNDLFRQQDYKRAAERYEEAIKSNPDLVKVYFFLGNSYDQQYKASKAGDPQNDQYIQKAIENYKIAAQRDDDPKMRKLALQYLFAAYGPEKLNDPSKAEPIVQQLITADPSEPANYFQLSKLYEDAGRYEDAEKALLQAKEMKPSDPSVYTQLAAFYNRQGDFDKTIESLQQAADLAPNNPEGYQLIAAYYWEKASKDFRLPANVKADYIQKGIAADDKALSLNANYVDALVYKNILLRMQANMEKDPAKQKDLLNKADQLRQKAMDLQKQGRRR